MVWAPTKANREAIKFWLDCLQIVTVVVGVVAVGGTFYFNSVAERARAAEQARREEDQLAAIKRELERPYQEKKLALYLDAARVRGYEHAQLPGDDLPKEAVSTEAIAYRVVESGQLDAIGAHHPDAAKLEFLREVEDGASLHQRGKGSVRRQRGRVPRKDVCDPCGRKLASDDAFARIGLEPIDAG